MTRRATTAALSVLVTALFIARAARAATVSGASIRSRGDLVELHFDVRGAEPQWQLRGEHQHLTIALAGTRIATATRPLAGREILPVTDVQAIAMTDGNAQLVIGVKGKVDYAATLAAHELIVRFAHTGTAPDIDAPILIRNAPRRMLTRLGQRPQEPVAQASIAAKITAPAAHDASAVPQYARLDPSQSAQRERPFVMIDPGHGGFDPGTRSANGVAEKDLTLPIAARLQRSLQALGVNATLTRADDRFVSLAQRAQMANRRRADLFVSIHLNSSPNPATAGIETYYLNNTNDRATIRLARMENGVSDGSSEARKPTLNYLLTDLRQGDKANESVALARMIETESAAAIAATSGIKVNALGAKQGPFYVLIGAEMPAVLVECGFLSNRTEADHLADPAYQQGLAEGVATAIGNYFNNRAAVGNL